VQVVEVFFRADGAGEHVVGGGEVAPRRADVPPVGARDVRPETTLGLEVREYLTLYRNLLILRYHGKHLRLHHVDAGVHQVRRHLVGGGLLQETAHQHVVVHLDEPIGGGVLDAYQHDRRQGVRLFVPLYRHPQVHPREDVPVHNDEGLTVEVLFGVLDPAGRPQSVVLDSIVY
jgi:hypothetical protein